MSTISLIMINSISHSAIENDLYYDGICGKTGARLWLLAGYICGFSSLIASLWLMIDNFFVRGKFPDKWPGIALFLQNFLIFAASLTLKFGRKFNEDGL